MNVRKENLRPLVVLGTAVIFTGCCPHDKTDRPNIIVILADDMGFSDIGCFGGEIDTPNIDRIGREGLTMTQGYNAARSCPTRACLMTGMYSHKAGMGAMIKPIGDLPNYQGYLDHRCLTIAEVLRDNGYVTGMSGKWHLGDQDGNWPCDRGFDESFVFLPGAGNYFYPNGKDPEPDRSAMAHNNEYYYPPVQGYYQTDAFTDHAVDFIKAQNGEKPFFLYLAYTAPHWPLQAHPEDIRKYDGVFDDGWDELRVKRWERLVRFGILKEEWGLSERDSSVPAWDSLTAEEQKKWSEVMEIYAAMIDRMDQGIGRVLTALEEKGELDNTLILFLSDNGACAEIAEKFADLKKFTGPKGSGDSFLAYESEWANLSNAPFRYFKHWMHEGGISTPILVRYPSMIKAGTRTDVPVHVIDILPTCMEVSASRYPQRENLKSMDGKSFVPLFNDPEAKIHDCLFFEHFGFRALRKGDYKIVSSYPENKWELYNITDDRTELHDLSAEMPEIVEEMDRIYREEALRNEVTDWKEVAKIQARQRRKQK